jgi:hypothetical protein
MTCFLNTVSVGRLIPRVRKACADETKAFVADEVARETGTFPDF